jgi:hypothetical protein
MYLHKGISIKTLQKKKIFFCCRLEGQSKEQDLESDPLVKGTDLRFRICTKNVTDPDPG